ncbi:MAG: hypothetical protein V7637_708 [Mycobacteriales bacterium]
MPAASPDRPVRLVARCAAALALSVAFGTGGVVVAGAAAAIAPATASPAPTASVKFWIVAPERNGRKEFLFQIAERSLGDGNRFPEIFNLNKGRRQPDGGRLADPSTLLPGWILQLPPDAHGSGVHFGPLPYAAPSDGSGPTVSGTTSAPAAAVVPPADGASRRRLEVGIAAGVSIAVAVFVLLMLVLSGRRRRHPARPLDDSGPPARAAWPAVGDAPASAGAWQAVRVGDPAPLADGAPQGAVSPAVPVGVPAGVAVVPPAVAAEGWAVPVPGGVLAGDAWGSAVPAGEWAAVPAEPTAESEVARGWTAAVPVQPEWVEGTVPLRAAGGTSLAPTLPAAPAEESTVDGGLVEWVRQLRSDPAPAAPQAAADAGWAAAPASAELDNDDAPPWGGRLVAPGSTDAGWQPAPADRRPR